MTRNFVIGIKKGKSSLLAFGVSDSEAYKTATDKCKDFDDVDIYINATPHSSFNHKAREQARKLRAEEKAKAKKQAKKQAKK